MSESAHSASSSAKSDYWSGHVSDWSESGLSAAEYSRRHGLAAHCLRYWIKKLNGREPAAESSVDLTGGVELVAVDLCSGSGPDAEAFRAASGSVREAEAFPLRVILSNGFAVEVVGDFDGAVFEKLLMILGRL
jgi:hypothetical protein